jgi:hypothetical protein
MHMSAHAHAPLNPFNAEEVAYLRAQDYSAGKAIVVLMCGIFFSGIVIYSIVAWSVLP